MGAELLLRFPTADTVSVRLSVDDYSNETAPKPFACPLDGRALEDLHWYLEKYPVQYMTEIDDGRANRIAESLRGWGEALFAAVFTDAQSSTLFNQFLLQTGAGRRLTVSAGHPAVLAQPWELLRAPGANWLFLEQPGIPIRRALTGTGGGRLPQRSAAKDQVHLLFVVSRPAGAGFIDPRADAAAVMDAIGREAPGRVTVEFLRPATLDALVERLEDARKPAVDVLHFDGHGVYDTHGALAERVKAAPLPATLGGLMREAATATRPHQGYLLFEDERGAERLVPAGLLGELLWQRRVGLVVLSACQSATVGGEDALGSVAAHLTHAGIPSVLAMTHSVLVATTRALFGPFYRELAAGAAIGAALDRARAALYRNRGRGERRRGDATVELELQDWFVPALYQSGLGSPLLTADGAPAERPVRGNLPAAPETGFFGRGRELWEIERRFAAGTRRLWVHGFGGQGKTALAEEAGRWLSRAGLFDAACIVRYDRMQGSDAVALALAELGGVLGTALIDAAAATAALAGTATLLVLDNLESLPDATRAELLTAAAAWSTAGRSRVLATSRDPDPAHAGWPTGASNACRLLALDGLTPADAQALFDHRWTLSPEPSVPLPARAALETLFARVGFHPLSLGLLADLLKERRIGEVGPRLVELLAQGKSPLLASLTLSLDRLDPDLRRDLPRLAVFQGGASEPMILDVTEIPPERWAALRRGLERTGLVTAERVPGTGNDFLRFHPTLAPALDGTLTGAERAATAERYAAAYEALAAELYELDTTNPEAVRAVARRELPNLMAAVDARLIATADSAPAFADRVCWFLRAFGLTQDRVALAERAAKLTAAPGSDGWYRAQSTQGEALIEAGRYTAAEALFRGILAALPSAPSYARGATLARLARCLQQAGRAGEAAALLGTAIAEMAGPTPTENHHRLLSALHTNLGTCLRSTGDHDGARTAYRAALPIAEALGDARSVAVVNAQLGALALQTGDLSEAATRYQAALNRFRELGEPATEAVAWHQLGIVYQTARHWDAAAAAFRESTRLKESRGDTLAAARSWGQLAQVRESAGHPEEAEGWYLKALAAYRTGGAWAGTASTLNNLADLLAGQPARLVDARALAEEALAIEETLDPDAAEVWKTHGILARIAERDGRPAEASAQRRRARERFAASPHARTHLRQWRPEIHATVQTAADPAHRPAWQAEVVPALAERGYDALAAALARLLDGERDEAALVEPLDWQDSLIVATVLRALADPASLERIAADGA